MDNLTNASLPSFYPAQIAIDKYVTIPVLIIGLPGNVLSLIVWMQKRMRHSSGYYLAALAVNDIAFLVMAQILDVHVIWQTAMPLSVPVMCELFPVVYLSLQALSPCLVLAFTTERYISVCHPFRRETYCTIKRAKTTVLCLAVSCAAMLSPYGYFFTLYTNINNDTDCGIRESVNIGGHRSVFSIYDKIFNTMAYFVVPMAILILNILVICEMRRLSRMEPTQLQGNSGKRTGTTTVMLLVVSFYQIITTLPISVVYNLMIDFDYEPDIYGVERARKRFMNFHLVHTIIKEYGITHYAFNFIIYLITGKMFRQELKRIILKPFNKPASSHYLSESFSRGTGYTSVRQTNPFRDDDEAHGENVIENINGCNHAEHSDETLL